jgi:YbgC/YbaW family acyl-CoA thioester hydrolase
MRRYFEQVMSDSLEARATVEIRVRWADTDTSGRVYFGTVFQFFEQAEVELWRALGAIDLFARLPRVHAEADYLRPLLFDDTITVSAAIERLGSTSVTLTFEITRGSERTCTGRVVAVHVPDTPHGAPRPLPPLGYHGPPPAGAGLPG